MPQCPACCNDFSYSGYARHLAQTTNPECRAIYEDLLAFETHSDVDSAGRSDSEPHYFDGDLFGSAAEYGPDDFGWLDPNDQMNLDHEEDRDVFDNAEREEKGDGDGDGDGDEDEDEDFLAAELDGGWEPPPPAHSPVLQPEEPIEPAWEDGDHAHPLQQIRLEAEEQLCKEPIIVRFPYGNAGAPIANAEAGGHHAYKNKIHDPQSYWAPFKSKMEWEIARWAKLRGPGSTAFDDLLRIEGVSDLLLNIFMIYSIISGQGGSFTLLFKFKRAQQAH
jgi:hypothetical protein